MAGERWVVAEAAVLVRSGFDMKSKPVGQLKKGEELACLESKVNEKGTTRIRFKERLEGWVSLTAGDGTVLLEKVGGSPQAQPKQKAKVKAPPVRSKPGKKPAGAASATAESTAEIVSYKVTEKSGARVRAGFDMKSAPAGALKFGDEIEALETKVNAQGTTRLRFAKGWVSVTAGDGSVLLEKVPPAESGGGGGGGGKSKPTRSAAPAAKGATGKYKVVEPQGVLVRAGFDMKSKPVGQLKKGEEVECLESKLNDKGTTRIRFNGRLQGWVSLTAGNGDTLLDAIADSEDDVSEDEKPPSPAPGKVVNKAAPPTRTKPATRPQHSSDSSDSSDSEHSGWTEEEDEPKKPSKKADASSESVATESSGTTFFRATCPVLVRTGFAMNSKPAGQLQKGEEVESIEIKKNDNGVDRVHFKGRLSGWASATTKDGATLLELLEGSKPAPAVAPAKAKAKVPSVPKSDGLDKKTTPPIPKKGEASSIPKKRVAAPTPTEKKDDADSSDSSDSSDSTENEEDEEDEGDDQPEPAPKPAISKSAKKGGGRAPSAAALRLEEEAPVSGAEEEPDSAVSDWLNSEPVRLGQYAAAFAEAGLIMQEDLTDMDDEDIEDIAKSSGMKKAETKRFARELAKLKAPSTADEDTQEKEQEEVTSKAQVKQSNAKQLRLAYRVVEKGGIVVREGFDMKSAYRGNLPHNVRIEVLESRKNNKGVMRIRFWWKNADAWVSTHAGDGTVLLEEVEELNERESESGGSESDTVAESVESDTVDDLFSSAIQNNLVVTLDNKIVAACRTGKVDLAMDVLQLVVGQGESPGSEALSALIIAQSKVSIKKSFKLLQYGIEVPPASLPSPDAVVAFVQHCEAASIDTQAVERVESILTSMHERGFTVTKQVKAAVRSLRQSAATAEQKEKEAAAAAEAQKAKMRAQAEEPAVALSRTESFPQDESTDSDFDSENEWSSPDEDEDAWLKEAEKTHAAAAPAAAAPVPKVMGEQTQQLFRVVAPGGVTMREGFTTGSRNIETLSCGALVEAVEVREDDSGNETVRCAQGWADTETSDGLSLLARVDSAESPWSIASEERSLPVAEQQQSDQRSDTDSQSDSLDSLHLDDDDSDGEETVTTQSTRSTSSRSSRSTSSSRSSSRSSSAASTDSSRSSRSSRSSSSRDSSATSTSMTRTSADGEDASSDEDWELNESGFRNISCIGAERMVDENRQPYAVYRFAVQDTAPDGVTKGKAWRIARRFATFLELRETLKSPDVLPDDTARNTISQLPFPSKSHSFADKLDPRLLDQRAVGLERYMKGVLRWAARGAVVSFLYDDGSDNAVLDMASSQHFMAGSESAGMRWSRPLVAGNRSPAEKNSFFIRGVGRGAQDMVLSVLTPPGTTATDISTGRVSFADSPNTVQLMSKSARGHFRSCVCDMDHRYVQPPSELAYIKRSKDTNPTRKSRKKEQKLNGDQGYKLLVFRPMFALGSLRDMIFRSPSPLDHHSLKYRGMGTPLPERRVSIYGRQIIEGMLFLTKIGFDVSGCHAGNIMMRSADWCTITEFENAALGLKPLGANANVSSSNNRPEVTAFGMLLYEMASGYQPADIARVTIPPCALTVQDALQSIFHTKASARGATAAAAARFSNGGEQIAAATLGLTLGQVLSLDLFAQSDGLTPSGSFDADKAARLRRRLKRSIVADDRGAAATGGNQLLALEA